MKTLRLLTHVPAREAVLSSSRQPFDWVENGQLKVNIGQRYPLADAPPAYLDIASAGRREAVIDSRRAIE
jgi:NADPH:quinone reductase-like Zn-dependent oxidoreductase